MYDEVGIGGGASGASGGLLHPYSPKEYKPLIKMLRRSLFLTCVPFHRAFYMPQSVNVNPRRYLQALFAASENLVKDASTSNHAQKELYFHKKSVYKLLELEGNYDAVIICLGAQADMLPELSGRLPLRTCRGIIAHLHLPTDKGKNIQITPLQYCQMHGLLSRGHVICTRVQRGNGNLGILVQMSQKMKRQASAFYPGIKDWTFGGAKAGLRAMPPLTPHGSLPLLGSVNHLVGVNCTVDIGYLEVLVQEVCCTVRRLAI